MSNEEFKILKFRCFNTSTKTMYYPDYIILRPLKANEEISSKGFFSNLPSHPVMQYINLEDKNDKEIYEGDILKIGDKKGVVKFKGGSYVCIYSSTDIEGNSFNAACSIFKELITTFKEEREVIGNIYQNLNLKTYCDCGFFDGNHGECNCGGRYK